MLNLYHESVLLLDAKNYPLVFSLANMSSQLKSSVSSLFVIFKNPLVYIYIKKDSPEFNIFFIWSADQPVKTQRTKVVIEEIVDGQVVNRTEDVNTEVIN